MVDFSEHLQKARISYSNPALVDKRILAALIRLTRTPGQRGFVLGEELMSDRREEVLRELRGKPMSAAIIQTQGYDSQTSTLRVLIRAKDGYGRRVYLNIPPSEIRAAEAYIARNRRIGVK